MSEMQITFGSLFAGIGGFDLGFERAGMTCRWQVEIDDYAIRVLEKHWPNVRRARDIRDCGSANLDRVDVICGGFPCQDISYAGFGAGLDGARSGLFFEAVRVVFELQPRAVVLENVAALLSRGLDRVLGTMAEIGYDAEWHCVPAAYVGAPHIRDRVFIIGKRVPDSDRDGWETRARIGRIEETPWITHGDHAERLRGEISDADNERPQGIGARDDSERRQEARRPAGLCDGEESGWIVDWWEAEPAVGRVANGIPARVDRLRGLGNAVVPQVAEWIGLQIVNRLTSQSGDAA